MKLKKNLRRRYSPYALVILSVLTIRCTSGSDESKLSHEYLTSKDGFRYQLITWDNLQAEITLERPDKNSKANLFCIPITPPDTEELSMRHFYCASGETSDDSRFNADLGGALSTKNGKLNLLFPSGEGGLQLLKNECASGAHVAQVRAALHEGKIMVNENRKKYQCRAIVELNDGRTGMIETLKHNTQLQFAQNLRKFGVKNAVLTVTGSFDEGWYDYADVPIALGRLQSRTAQQSNWLLVR